MSARSLWPALPSGFVRTVLGGHSVLGLAAGALLYLVCLSGSLAVFVAELGRWEQADGPERIVATPDAYQRAMEASIAAMPDPSKVRSLFVIAPTPEAPYLSVSIGGKDGHHWLVADDGSLIEHQAEWSEFVGSLHMHLNLPSPWGITLVGLTGVALLALLISGVLAHPRIFRDAFSLRWGGSKRLQEADLHNRLSVWGLPFHLVVTLTGAFYGLSSAMLLLVATLAYGGDAAKVFATLLNRPQGEQLASAAVSAASVPDIAAVVRDAQRRDHKIGFIAVDGIGTDRQLMALSRDVPGRLLRGEYEYFDGAAKPLAVAGFANGPLGTQLYGASGPAHFGTFGGLPVKLAYLALGLALTVITVSGVSIWLARRRDRGAPALRTERAWMWVVWGVPFALAASCCAVLAWQSGPVAAFWISFAAAGLAMFAGPAPVVSRVLRAAVVAAILATLVVHTARFGALVLRTDIVVIDLSALALVAVLLWSLFYRVATASSSSRSELAPIRKQAGVAQPAPSIESANAR